MELFEKLRKVKAFIFDVDGVLTDGKILMTEAGEQLRAFDIKDGYALRALVDLKIPIAVISGGNSVGVRKRLEYLGITKVFLGASDKKSIIDQCLQGWKLQATDILFMGDDLPDLVAMQLVGFSCCPRDASEEVKAVSHYISHRDGGHGAVRDVVEKVLKLQDRWPTQIHTANG